jgi:hypothetical protein
MRLQLIVTIIKCMLRSLARRSVVYTPKNAHSRQQEREESKPRQIWNEKKNKNALNATQRHIS